MKKRAASATVLLAVSMNGCGSDDTVTVSPAAASPTVVPVTVSVASATIKRSEGKIVTALRGTANAGATVEVDGRSTVVGSDGGWAIRANYARSRDDIKVTVVSQDGKATAATSYRQPKRPGISISGPLDRTVYSDIVTLSGRIKGINGGSVEGARVFVNGVPAAVIGGRWTKQVTVSSGRRYFTFKATKPGHDGDESVTEITRRLSAAEKAARAAQRKAERDARIARRRAADPTYGMSNEEILDACFAGTITDFKTCYKAGYKVGAEGADEAMEELEAEGYLDQ